MHFYAQPDDPFSLPLPSTKHGGMGISRLLLLPRPAPASLDRGGDAALASRCSSCSVAPCLQSRPACLGSELLADSAVMSVQVLIWARALCFVLQAAAVQQGIQAAVALQQGGQPWLGQGSSEFYLCLPLLESAQLPEELKQKWEQLGLFVEGEFVPTARKCRLLFKVGAGAPGRCSACSLVNAQLNHMLIGECAAESLP